MVFSCLCNSLSRFAAYNLCEAYVPEPIGLKTKIARNAFIGFTASVASDLCSNGLHAIKVRWGGRVVKW